MKPLKSLLAVSLSAAMLFSAPVSGITGMEPQTVEAATKSCKLNRSSVTMNAGSSTRLTLSNAVWHFIIAVCNLLIKTSFFVGILI